MLVKIFLKGPKNDSRIPNSRVDVIVIETCEKVKFSGSDEGGFIWGKVRNGVLAK